MIPRRPISPAAALVRLEELCSRSEQCTSEVVAKLTAWGVEPEIAHKIIRRLKARRFIDDSRYACAFVRDKIVYNRWGSIKVRQALRLKKIDADLIDEALAAVDQEEYRNALIEVIRAKIRTLPPPLDFAKKQKILRHAASRGFEPALVIEILKRPDLWN